MKDLNYIDRKAQEPRTLYKGPDLTKNELAIKKALLDIYNFDFSAYKMLCDANDPEQCNSMQINSPENYVRFHLVSLLEKMRATPGGIAFKSHDPGLYALSFSYCRDSESAGRTPKGKKQRVLTDTSTCLPKR